MSRGAFAILAIGASSFSLLQSMVLPVMSEIREVLRTDPTTVTWVLSAYLLSAAVCTPLLGKLGDALGRKPMLIFVLMMLSVGSVIAALAPNIVVMIAARVIQGVGGGILPLSFGIIRDQAAPAKARAWIATLAAMSGVGAGFGLVLAGPVIDVAGYQWLFWLPGIVTGLTAVAAAVIIPRTARRPSTITWFPAVLMSSSLVLLLLVLTKGAAWGWLSLRVLVLLPLALALVWAWVAVERRVRYPLIDMRMMWLAPVRAANAMSFLFGICAFSVFAFVPTMVQSPRSTGYGLGASIGASGLIVLPLTVGSLVGGLGVDQLVRLIGIRWVTVAGSLLMSVSMVMIAFGSTVVWLLCAGLAIQGIGSGLLISALSSLVVMSVPAAHSGAASGMNANIRMIGGAIGAAAMAAVVTAQIPAIGYPDRSRYLWGFTGMAVVMVIAAIAAFAIPKPERKVSVQLESVPGVT